VQFIEGDASAEHLGLPKDLYEEVSEVLPSSPPASTDHRHQIRSSVTVIIHNAWRLDFNLALSSFEPNVRGTRHLLDLALTATHASAARVLFTSSIAVTQAWPRANGPFPEAPQDDVRWCLGSGYGEGKYVAEQVRVEWVISCCHL
jgi:nucleoside-diphosphate-sugar epimerase